MGAGHEGGQERLAFLGTMAGGLAHEIKNPLSTMTITLGLLREDLEAPTIERERALRRIQVLDREATRLEEILSGFLQFAGRHRLQIRPTDLNEVVGEILDFVFPSALEKRVVLRRHLASDLPLLPLDRDRVKQALLNLTNNALDAMDGSRGELLVQTSLWGPAVRVDVTDTGPGIPPDILPRVFDAYFSTKRTGTGIGLAIVKRIAEEHGGAVEVYSDVGKGTRFTLWFPLQAPAVRRGHEEGS